MASCLPYGSRSFSRRSSHLSPNRQGTGTSEPSRANQGDLLGLPIYEWVILACLAASIPGVLAQLKPRSLYQQPITVCILCLLPAIVLSHLAHANLYSARWTAFEFFKVVVYYLLLVANVSSAARLRQFLFWLVVLIGALALLALLQYYEVIDIPSLAALQQRQVDLATDQESILLRLQ